MKGRTPPRRTTGKSFSARRRRDWGLCFLRSLVRTGEVRAAALEAGIDEETANERRTADPQFAGLWRGALRAHEMWKVLKAQKTNPTPSPASPPGQSALSRRRKRRQ